MRLYQWAGLGFIAGSAVLPFASLSAAEPLQVRACPTQAKTEQVLQSNGSLNPDGCRTITITRVESPAGALCVMDFGESQGILGAITSAAVPSQWWTSCSNVRQP